MKKRFLAVVMSCMLMAGAVTGCGSKTADAPTTAATEVTTEAVPAAELVEAEGSYLAWNGAEWNKADEAEKTAAARAYLIETAKLAAETTGQEYTSEMEASITDEHVATVMESLEAAFAADESITIQQMLDAASEVMSSMVETEAAE